VKEEQIKTEPLSRLFEVFNVDKTKSGEVIWFALLELEINRHIEIINAAVMNLNGMDEEKYKWKMTKSRQSRNGKCPPR